MRIGLVGTICSGKTTLAKALAEELNITLIPESFDKAIEWCNSHDYAIYKHRDWSYEKWFDVIYKASMDYRMANFETGLHFSQIEREQAVEDNYITDAASIMRVVGCLTYCSILCSEFSSRLNILMQTSMKHMSRYTHIFYLPNVLSIEADGNRIPNPLIQQQSDLLLYALLNRYYIKYVHVPVVSLPDRINFVKNWIYETI